MNKLKKIADPKKFLSHNNKANVMDDIQNKKRILRSYKSQTNLINKK